MKKPAARVGDMHTCPMMLPIPHVGGPILPSGNSRVFINGLPAATQGTPAACASGVDVISGGSLRVCIQGMPAARVGDLSGHGGVITTGSPNVYIG